MKLILKGLAQRVWQRRSVTVELFLESAKWLRRKQKFFSRTVATRYEPLPRKEEVSTPGYMEGVASQVLAGIAAYLHSRNIIPFF